MIATWQNLSINIQRLFIATGILMAITLIGMMFHVSSQGDMSETYPKGFRGGTCTIETDTLMIGYSAYFIPGDYAIPGDAMSAMTVPILCGKVPGPGLLSISVDLLYPVSAREQPVAVSLIRKNDEGTAETVLSIPARVYQSGIISQEARINEIGEYILQLSGKDEHQSEFQSDIPMTVGTQWYEALIPHWPMLVLCMAAIFLINLKRLVS